MKRLLHVVAIAALVAVSLPAAADLQNVIVGGSVRIRANYWSSAAGPDSFTGRNQLFQPPWTPSFAPAGINPLWGLRWPALPGKLAVFSGVDWNESGSDVKFVEQRTRLNAAADFTNNVRAFIELDSYDWWGTDFRSDYLTGADAAAVSVDDVEIYQAYIEASEMWGMPLSARIGRQELKFGSGWLIGTNEAGSFFRGLSFDGIRLTYATDLFSVDGVWAKLAERTPFEQDEDVDLYAVYGSYLGIENITLDAYWMLVRDAISLNDTNLNWFGEGIENLLDIDDYDVTNLHTVGLRGAGMLGAFNFEAELAYQFGDADAVGRRFAGAGLQSLYGDDGPDFEAWGANAMFGYTFETAWNPMVFIGGSYLGGEDNRDVDFGEWLSAVFNPFYQPDASVSFNRLFSDWQYGQFVGSDNHDCTNLWLAYAGVSAMPTESIKLTLSAAYVESLENYTVPWPTWTILGLRIAPLAPFTFLDQENDSHLCTELMLSAKYAYSEDLSFEVGYSHLFLGDGAAEGNFNLGNGLLFEGGTDDEDADYFYCETQLKF